MTENTPVRLHSRTLGEGPPLYILHGLFGSGRNWMRIARQLSERFEVHLVDQRNHGESEHTDTMTYLEMAEDVAGLITEDGHAAAHLLGHSMGGKTAMALALDFPSLVDRLIVADIAPVRYPVEHTELIAAMQSLPLAQLTGRRQAEELLAEDIPDPMLRQFLLQSLVREEDGFRWQINLPAVRENLHELADFPIESATGKFPGPSLFLAGGDSTYIQTRHHESIRQLFPASRIRVIDGAGHWLHAERPQQFLHEIVRFLPPGKD